MKPSEDGYSPGNSLVQLASMHWFRIQFLPTCISVAFNLQNHLVFISVSANLWVKENEESCIRSPQVRGLEEISLLVPGICLIARNLKNTVKSKNTLLPTVDLRHTWEKHQCSFNSQPCDYFPGDICQCLKALFVVTSRVRATTDISWVEARDTAEYPAIHQTALPLPRSKN